MENNGKRLLLLRVLRAAAISLCVLGLLMVFLPRIISLPPFRRMSLAALNARIPGAVAVDSWHLRWFDALRIDGLRFEPSRGPLLEVERVSAESGLWDLLIQRRAHVSAAPLRFSLPEEDRRLPEIETLVIRWRRTASADEAHITADIQAAGILTAEVILPRIADDVIRISGYLEPIAYAGRPALEPWEFEAELASAPDSWTLHRARVVSGFLEGSLSGSLQRAEARAVLDLDKLQQEMEPWIAPFDTQLAGTVNLDAQWRREPAWTVARVALHGEDVQWLQNDLPLLSESAPRLTAEARYGSDRENDGRIDNVALLLSFSFLEAEIEAAGVTFAAGAIRCDRWSSSGTLGLDDIPPGWGAPRLSGGVEFSAAGDAPAGVLRVDNVAAAAPYIAARAGGEEITGADIELQGTGIVWEFKRRQLKTDRLAVTSAAGNLELVDIILGYLPGEIEVGADLRYEGSVARLYRLAPEREPPPLPPDVLELTGRLGIGGSTWSFDGLLAMDLDEADEWRLSGSAGGDMRDGSFSLNNGELTGPGIEMALSAGLIPAAESYRVRIKGQADYRWKELSGSRWFGDFLPPVTGSGSSPFVLTWPLGEEVLCSAVAGFQVQWDSIDLEQAPFGPGHFALALDSGSGTVHAAAELLDGTLEAPLRLECRDGQPLLKAPQTNMMVRGVRLDSELSGITLGKIHPLFSGGGIASGSVDVVMHDLEVPLTAEWRSGAVMSARFHFNEVLLEASGLLEEVLELLSIREDNYYLGNVEWSCRIADGLVKGDPLRLKPGGYELILDGTVGLDGDLDYRLEVPLTREMVGREIYPYVDGIRLRIPIRGTVDDPRLGREEFIEAVRELVADAVQRRIEKGARRLLEGLFQ